MTASTAVTPLRELATLPGPMQWPVVGNAFQIRVARAHLDVEAWARRYGGLFRFRLGPTHVLGITDHEAIAAVLKARPDTFRRTERTALVAQEMGLPAGLFGAEGDDWRRQRRMVMAGFTPANVRDYFPSLLRVTLRLQRRWQTAAAEASPVLLQSDLMRYTVDGVAGLAFGSDINTLESDEEVIQHHLDKIFPALFRRIFSQLPYWRWLRLPRDRDLDRSVAAINDAIAGFIAAARSRLQSDPARRERPGNLLEAMIVAAEEGGSGLDDRHVVGNVLTMLLAGEDTTANTLAWMIDLLWRHPQALQRAVAEVAACAPDASAFTPEQMNQLVYLEACAHETMRLKPVAPFLPLQAVHDTTVADVRVPAGTIVWCVMRHDSVSEPHVAEPARFDPERWLADHAAPGSSSIRRVAMPFGAGPRVCPGRHLAMLEIKMAMAMLLGSFRIERVGTADGSDAAECMAFSMSPVGLEMRLRPLG